MKIDMTTKILDLSGKPVNVPGAATPTPMTLRNVCEDVLLVALPGDESMSSHDKVSNYHLSLRIHAEDAPDLKVEELTVLKDRIGRAYLPLIVGRAFDILDPPAQAAE